MIKQRQFPARAGIILLVVGLVLAIAGCGILSTPPPERITEDISTQTEVNFAVQSEVMSLWLASYASAPPEFTIPDPLDEPTTELPDSSLNMQLKRGRGFDWSGPDSQGWYTRSSKWGYGGDYWYTEKYRYIASENAVEYQTSLTYNGADGDFSYETKSRSAVNDQGLLDGYYNMKTKSSGYNDISNVEYEYRFTDLDKQTGAGWFEWWFGANSLGSTYNTPFHRYMSINATTTGEPGWLHLHVYYYDSDGYSLADWEYDCMYTPMF